MILYIPLIDDRETDQIRAGDMIELCLHCPGELRAPHSIYLTGELTLMFKINWSQVAGIGLDWFYLEKSYEGKPTKTCSQRQLERLTDNGKVLPRTRM